MAFDDDEDDETPHGSHRPAYERKPPKIRSLLGPRTIPRIVQVQDKVTGEWRNQVRLSKERMTDEQKGIFLVKYQEWGRIAEAAAYAGVSSRNVRKEAEQDEEFGLALVMAEDAYREKLIAHHQDLLFNGQVKENYDRNGNLVSREQVFPIPLIQMELKKHDKGYRDKQEVEVTHTGGVLVAPSTVSSIDDWSRKWSPGGAIEGDFHDVTPSSDRLGLPSSSSSSSED